MNPPSTRPDHLTVIANHDPGPHVTDSDDIQWWWPCLGPSASSAAQLLARHSRHGDVRWPIIDLAHRIGLGALCSKMWATLDRLEGFGLLSFISTMSPPSVSTCRCSPPASCSTSPRTSPPPTW
jgi:hypothetical protein